MVAKTKVSDIMKSAVVTMEVGQSARQAQHLMRKHGVHALPVVDDNGELLGIVSTMDLVKEHDPDNVVARFMTTGVRTVSPDTPIEAAVQLMRENLIHHLVVVDAGKIVGILSTFDLLRLVEEAETAKHESIAKSDTDE